MFCKNNEYKTNIFGINSLSFGFYEKKKLQVHKNFEDNILNLSFEGNQNTAGFEVKLNNK